MNTKIAKQNLIKQLNNILVDDINQFSIGEVQASSDVLGTVELFGIKQTLREQLTLELSPKQEQFLKEYYNEISIVNHRKKVEIGCYSKLVLMD